MKCKHEPCMNEAKGQGKYCSKSCRAQQSRRNKAGATGMAQQAKIAAARSGIIEPSPDSAEVSLAHYQEHPDMYATRTNPTLINWDAPMTMAELNKAGLKGNRTAIPGDHDYVGCWQRQGTPPKPRQGVNAV